MLKGLFDTLCSATLSLGLVEALDALFPAFDGYARELFMEDPYGAAVFTRWLSHFCNIGSGSIC
jgi:hypothetical protein